MGFSTDGFVAVEAEKNPTWNCFSVKNPTEGLPATKLVADETSWIAGYYLEMKQIQGKKPNGEPSVSTLHTIQLIAVGDPKHLSEPVEVGGKVQFFGKSSLDDNIVKNVMPGTAIHIKWLGLQPNKSNPAMPYHGFTVMVNPNDKISAMPGVIGTTPSVSQEAPPLANTPQSLPSQEESDLPF